MSADERTKDELQDELRDRDLPVSGTKDELLERLREADREDVPSSGGSNGSAAPPPPKRRKPIEIARSGASQLGMLTGRKVEGISGLEPAGDGWRLRVEVLEVSRVPSSTDVLGSYEVSVDADGDLVGYERIRRYVRAGAGEDER